MTINPHPKPARKQKSPPRPLGRSEKPIKRSAIKPKNAKRRKSEFARCYHSRERVEFVKGLLCVVPFCAAQPSENSHISTGGTGRKADYTEIVPMCAGHHRMFHKLGRQTWESLACIDLNVAAYSTEKRWQAWLRVSGTPEQESEK